MKKYLVFGAAGLVFAVSLVAAAKSEEEKRVGDPYTLNTCPVSGEKLGSMGESPIILHEGREIRFCCEGCVKKYQASAEAMNQEIDKKLIKDQESHYPTNTCINSGAELKEGGVSFIVGNRLVKTCCENCKAKVLAKPAEYLAKLDTQVIEAQKAAYKMDACPVSGEKLNQDGHEAVEVVVANRLVKLCCEGCKKGLDKDPLATLEKVDAAAK
jgi:rRNA maturation protein Nop10